MFKERIVKFSDGTYGIQKGGWFLSTPVFLDLDDQEDYWRTQKNKHFGCCRKSLEVVTTIFGRRHLTFAPLKTDLSTHM